MKYSILYKEELDSSLKLAFERLPTRLSEKITNFLENHRFNMINEIRIHKNSKLMLIADSKNVITDIFIDEELINETVETLCQGSIYSHFRTIKEGYISVGGGIRAGICGKACLDDGKISGICEVSSINIRIPHHISNASSYLYDFLKENCFNTSVIIYSAPGVGKTTILRDLIYKLSLAFPPIRFAVIDSRDEITATINDKINADVYVSYPKGTAIELATKSMTPELIICDEISDANEAENVLKAVNSGVNLIATAHASSFEELKSKAIFSELFNAEVFDYALGVKREYGEKQYKFTLNSLK